MKPYKRPEKETDPNKLPGQIVNRPPGPDTLKHSIEQWERYEKDRNCCHQTMLLGYRCVGCPYAKPGDTLVPRRRG
jgi:hypothetical protein